MNKYVYDKKVRFEKKKMVKIELLFPAFTILTVRKKIRLM